MDLEKMKSHLKGSLLSKAMYPKNKEDRTTCNFIGIPLIDVLALNTEKTLHLSIYLDPDPDPGDPKKSGSDGILIRIQILLIYVFDV